MKTLTTNKLILRAFELNDSQDVFEYAKREDVGPLAGWNPHEHIQKTEEIIKQFIEKDEVYAIVYKDNQKVIGSLGIHFTTMGSLGDVYELGFVLHPHYHRQGIMTEAVHAALDEYFFQKNKDEIYVGHFMGNIPSEKIIHKLGFDFVEDIDYQSRDYGKKKTKIYKLTKMKYTLIKER